MSRHENANENQSFFRKIENFWYYYKWSVILGLLAVLIVAFFISEFTNRVPTDINISIVTKDMITEGSINFEQVLGEKIQDANGDGEKHITISRLFITEDAEDENTESAIYTLESQLADKGAVLFIMDQYNYERVMARDAFCPLNEMIDISTLGDRVLYRGDTPIALSLKGSALLPEVGITNDDLYALVLFKRDEDAQNQEINKQYENGSVILAELAK